MSTLKRVALGAALPLLLAPMACSKTEDPPATGTPSSAKPAGSSSTTAKPAANASTSVAATGKVGGEVTIEGNKFLPEKITVKAGESVKWTSKDKVPHEPTQGDGDLAPGGFDIEIAGGASGTSPALSAGTIKYFCAIHPSMKAEITVQ